MSTINATYVSVWDGGVEVRTKCFFNTETKEVSDIESADVNNLDVCEDEFIELPNGTEIRDFWIEGNEPESLSVNEII